MKCPKCQTRFSFLETLKMWNPNRYACPRCEAILKIGPKGKILIAVSCLIALSIATVAIVMEERELWTTIDSLKYFAWVYPVVLIPWSYLCWEITDCVEKE